MTLRDAILHSKETGCEFWQPATPWRRTTWYTCKTVGVLLTADEMVATDWVCSDGWTPKEP